jgi:gliding motility-associated-like protein
MKFVFFILILMITSNGYSQCNNNTFRLSLKGSGAETAQSIIEIAGGDMIIGGQTTSFGAGDADLFLTRMTKDGEIIWSKTYGGSAYEQFRRMSLALDGTILLAAQTNSFGNYQGDAVAMKIDLNGDVQWASKFSEAGYYSLGLDIVNTTDNGYILSGIQYAANYASDWMIVKLDASGNLVWSKKLNQGIDECAYSTIQKGDTLFVSGNTRVPYDYADIYVKMSLLDGTVYSTNAYLMDGRGAFGSKIEYSPAKEYRVSVHIIDGASYNQMQEGFIIMDEYLHPLKIFKLDVTPYDNQYFTGFTQTADSGYLVTGSPAGRTEGYLYKFDKQNNLAYSKRFSSSQQMWVGAAIEATDGSIWAIGSENNDALVMKLAADATFENCPNEPVLRNTTPVTYTSTPFSWNSISSYNFQNIQFSPTVMTFGFEVDSLCFVPDCGEIEISGQDMVCNLADTLTYTARTTGNCGISNPNWILPANVYSRMVNDSTIRVLFSAGGTHQIQLENLVSCGVQRDTFLVQVMPSPALALGPDSTLCDSIVLTLDAGAGFRAYEWQDGSASQTYNVTMEPGLYYVRATDYCNNAFSDSIEVNYRYPNDFSVYPRDTAYCESTQVAFQASGGDTYQWIPDTYLNDPDISNPIGIPTASVAYNVLISDTVCNRYRQLDVRITIDPIPDIEVSRSNDVNCSIGTAQLIAAGGSRYEWSPASSLNNATVANPVARPHETTTYVVKAYNSIGCFSEDSVKVLFNKTGSAEIYFPNAFSPNGDGKNDVFRVISTGANTLTVFSVYNRWGELIFTTNDISRGWDGTFKGILQEPGAYYWFVKAWNQCDGDLFKKGSVILVK